MINTEVQKTAVSREMNDTFLQGGAGLCAYVRWAI